MKTRNCGSRILLIVCLVVTSSSIGLSSPSCVYGQFYGQFYGGGVPPSKAYLLTSLAREGKYLAQEREMYDEIIVKQKALKEQITERPLRAEVSEEIQAQLAKTLVDVEIKLVGTEARVDAIQETIAITSDEIDKRITDDPAVQSAQKSIQAGEAQLNQAQEANAKAPKISASDLRRCESQLAFMQLELADRINNLQSSGLTTITKLNDQLLEARIQAAELSAQKHMIEKRLQSVRQMVEYRYNEETLEALKEVIPGRERSIEGFRRELEKLPKPE